MSWDRIAVALGALAFVVFLAATPASEDVMTAVSNLVQAVVPLAAVPCIALAARRATGRLRLAWTLLAGAVALWALGQVVWAWFEVVQNDEVPFPSLADVGFLGSVPLLLACVLAYPSASLPTVGRARALVDGGLVVSTLLFASYGSFLEVVYSAEADSAFERALAVAYPVADVLAIAVVIAVLARRRDRFAGPLPLVALGVVCLAVADSAFAYFTAKGTYTSNPVTDAGWPIGFALMALAARRSTDEDLAHDDVAAPSRLEVALPYLPVVPAVVVFVARASSGNDFGPFLGVTGGLVAVLLVARQLIALLENTELTVRLERTVLALRERETELQRQAFHDPLTALANRALFRDRLEHAIQRRGRPDISVLFIDLDDFKAVNDTLGHDAGDDLLVLVAERLRACTRSADTIARLGGDEFAVLVEGTTAEADGRALADRVLDAMDVPFPIAGRALRMRASVGVASGRYLVAQEVLKDADLAMYAAKAAGKARVVAFEPGLRELAAERLEVVGGVPILGTRDDAST